MVLDDPAWPCALFRDPSSSNYFEQVALFHPLMWLSGYLEFLVDVVSRLLLPAMPFMVLQPPLRVSFIRLTA
jgi:hypothetical protein